MFCKNCGAKIDNDSKFCINCGCEINTFVDKIESETINDSTIEAPNITSSNVEDEDRHSNDVGTANNIKEAVSENEDVIETLETDDDSDAIRDFAEPEENIDLSDNSVNDEVKIEKPSAVVESYDNEFSSVNGQKKKIMIIAGAIIVSIIALVVIIAIATSGAAERKMNKAIDTKNSFEVNSLYNYASGDSKKLEKYDMAIADLLEKVQDNLNNAEYSDDEMAEYGYTLVYRELESDWGSLIYSVNGDNIKPSISYYNQLAWDSIQAIIKSRAAFCSGIAYRDSYKQPKDAIDSFKQVTIEDSYYSRVEDEISKCVDLYVEQTLAEAEKLINQNNISDAIKKIDSINNYLENNGLTSSGIQEKLEETKKEYANSYAEKAEISFKEKNVEGAISNIDIAIELLPNDAEYQKKKESYEMYLPFELYVKDNCLSIEKTGFVNGNLSFEKEDTSNNNKEMNHCLLWYNNSSDSEQYITANYLLDGKYDVLSGTLFLTEENKDTSYEGFFEIYADGKLVYTSPKITKNVLPQDFKLSVTKVKNLKIIFYAQGNFTMMGGTYVDFGINNLTATKNFPD